jgi:hypothetical protein
MTKDIVERLRERAQFAREERTGTGLGDALHFEEAAVEIERLRNAKRRALALADERAKEANVLARAFLFAAVESALTGGDRMPLPEPPETEK